MNTTTANKAHQESHLANGSNGFPRDTARRDVVDHPLLGPLKLSRVGIVTGRQTSQQEVLQTFEMLCAGVAQNGKSEPNGPVANSPKAAGQQQAQGPQPPQSPAARRAPGRAADSAPSPKTPIGNSRAKVKSNSSPKGSPMNQDKGSARDLKAELARLMELAKQVESGDEDAKRRIFEILDGCPELWEQFGDLSVAAEAALIKAVYGGNVAMTAMVVRHRDNLKAQLLGVRPTLLVKLAVQRIIAIWMFLQYIDTRCSDLLARGSHLGELARLQAHAEQRFHRALRSLDFVRKSDVLSGRDVRADKEIGENAVGTESASRPSAPSSVDDKSSGAICKKSAVTHRRPAAACSETINCESPTQPFRPGEQPITKGAERIAPDLASSTNCSHHNGRAEQLS